MTHLPSLFQLDDGQLTNYAHSGAHRYSPPGGFRGLVHKLRISKIAKNLDVAIETDRAEMIKWLERSIGVMNAKATVEQWRLALQDVIDNLAAFYQARRLSAYAGHFREAVETLRSLVAIADLAPEEMRDALILDSQRTIMAHLQQLKTRLHIG